MSNKYLRMLFVAMVLLTSVSAHAQLNSKEIKNLVKNLRVTVGVAAIYGDEVMTYQNDLKYPMASVFKLPVTLCALNKMQQASVSLDQEVTIDSTWMVADTYSPLRDKYNGKSARLTLRELIDYCISESDNIACDWLLDYCGGPDTVTTYMKQLGLKHIKVTYTEQQLHQDKYHDFKNWCRPLDMARLLKLVNEGDVLAPAYRQCLMSALSRTTTGSDKIKAGLPQGAKLAHKTGHTDKNISFYSGNQQRFMQAAENDAGIITLPDGKQLYLVILLKLSKLPENETVKLAAQITRIVCKQIGAE